MKKKFTERGFAIYKFKDEYGTACSIQKSSSAMNDFIWLGAEDIGLKEFVANRNPGPSWQDVELENTIEHHYVANTRMHLSRKQVKKLLPVLKQFVDTGDI